MIRFDSAIGTSYLRDASGGGSSVSCAASNACGVRPWNGGDPTSISYATMPSA